jgi:hypothetical protein
VYGNIKRMPSIKRKSEIDLSNCFETQQSYYDRMTTHFSNLDNNNTFSEFGNSIDASSNFSHNSAYSHPTTLHPDKMIVDLDSQRQDVSVKGSTLQ